VGGGGVSIAKEHTGVWLFVYFISLVSAIALSLLLIGVGYERLAKVLFLWLPLIVIVVVKFLERPMLRRYFELGANNQWNIRKDAPRSVHILFGLIPMMAAFMVGYAYAHFFKHGSI
jgi:hypothetical protein